MASKKKPPPKVGVPNANNPEYRTNGTQTSRVTVNRSQQPKLARQRPTKRTGR